MKAIALLLFLAPVTAGAAETYLCIPEATVGIREDSNRFVGGVIDSGSRKLVVSNASGSFKARWHGNNHPFMDRCDAKGWTCQMDMTGVGGYFSRTADGEFILTWGESGARGTGEYYLARGRCSAI